MKIIDAGFEILNNYDPLKTVELAGRTCYKSEDRITDTSAERFVQMLILRGHEAMLEHGYVIFAIKHNIIGRLIRKELESMQNSGEPVPKLLITDSTHRTIVSGNLRAWREFLKSSSQLGIYFFMYLPSVILIGTKWEGEEPIPNEHVKPITVNDLKTDAEIRVHKRYTVRFTIDRGVSHEFVRHRVFSFAQESTRYCNYSNAKFGSEITVIDNKFIGEQYNDWFEGCLAAEAYYNCLIKQGATPQVARSVLPNSTKTELIMTGTVNDWVHFFRLRALGEFGTPHPQAEEVAKPLMAAMMEKEPIINKLLSEVE